MAGRRSAGLLLYRTSERSPQCPEVLLVHPGGPLWARRDHGVWSLPKGEYAAGEDTLACALREFTEETGAPPPPEPYTDLGQVVQKGGKHVAAFAARGDFDPEQLHSNTFQMVWPPRSTTVRSFPEVDRAAWFRPEQARERILPAQTAFLERLYAALNLPPGW